MLKQLIVICLLSLGIYAPLLAREATAEEKTAIDAMMVEATDALKVMDTSKSLEQSPPKLVESVAKASGVDIEGLKQAQIAAGQEMAKTVKITELTYSTEKLDLTDADGLIFGMVPVSMVMQGLEADAKKMKMESAMLALNESGKWYLISMSAESKPLVTELYPAVAKIEIPDPKAELVAEDAAPAAEVPAADAATSAADAAKAAAEAATDAASN